MKHTDFQIGTEFFTASGKWRCTDVGSDDPRYLNGSPYGVVEYVLTNTIWMAVPLILLIADPHQFHF